MGKRKTTPLKDYAPDGHHCSLELKTSKLGMVSFFRDLKQEDLDEIVKRFSATHYREGAEIYYQGDPANYLRVVVDGAVKLLRYTDEGKDVVLDILEPGSYFGSLKLLGSDVYTESAVAQSGCCILSVGLKDFREILQEYPSVGIAILEVSAEKLRSSQEQIKQLTTEPVETRIANILLTLTEKFGENKKEGTLIQLPFSRKDLADMAGTTTESASRVMSNFQKEGIIETGRQWVALKDIKKLRTIIED
ncbi:Crp/Fnr family transcriptional regulator [Gracilimonas mengyeensis]|uniref:cAMP-binding domain of CRP or a regulatory subunit of cAMP-dependent protein kinases n=1 Tax=Gracilimonas mengyeensis TaxID=1302730 RepID=A0A521D3J8_9BACT|nr:Crp/Fnr family transcriptional regulator [Gracilimonas mengyeensis]SMO66222.1 cAMP-binding domain of CRP or a regulatory subunit of cAMP-dependent protein kinases [Gracilimonas mengyeensis]